MAIEGTQWANGGNNSAFASFAQGAQPGVPTFTDNEIKDTSDKKLKDLRKSMNDLELYDSWQPNVYDSHIKLTTGRIYAIAFHPIKEKPLIFAGNKKGIIGDNDNKDAEIPLPKVSAFKMYTATISSIITPQCDHNSVISASYGSTIRCLDLPTQQPEDKNEDLKITYVDIAPKQKDVLVFSTIFSSLGRGLTDNKIGGFSLNPLIPHLVATASLNRTLKIWDLCIIKGTGDKRHPAILGEHQSRLSVSHSYDDTIKIYDISDAIIWKPGRDLGADVIEPMQSVRHNNQTGRWVTILKPKWQGNPGDGVQKFTIANINRFVDVYDSEGKQLAQISRADPCSRPKSSRAACRR
ncbi:WD repeat-containing protein [Apiospora saccharicola]|uniref:DNA damage-binding protein CMR1 n=1 Tax=Apiospora saccharicola TaxID=335842 RepID=A0ABR1W3Q4_9PEZI